MRKIVLSALAALAMGAQAQEMAAPETVADVQEQPAAVAAQQPAAAQEPAKEKKKITWISNVKVSGFAMGQYKYDGKQGAKANTFNLRMARVALDGRILNDFYWKAQIQFNGNTNDLGSSPRMVDLFVEWQKYDFFKVKFGQYKRPFTFENPMNPIDQGFMAYGQVVSKLAGFNDRVGEHASNGRDLGLQFQGDFWKNHNGRYLMHYQVGVFNGQGTNHSDVDNQKDVIGGFWVMPVAGLRIGAFGWVGSYARKGNWTEYLTNADGTPRLVLDEQGQPKLDDKGNTQQQTVAHTGELRKVKRNRFAVSAEYKANDWTLRSEYIRSYGLAFKTAYKVSDDAKKADINYAAGDVADGFYALAIAPVIKQKLHAKARYDVYRNSATWGSSRTQYEIGMDYNFCKYLQISGEYAYINDRTLAAGKHNYSQVDVELSFRF